MQIPVSLLFWILMIVWLVFGYLGWWPQSNTQRRTLVTAITIWLLLLFIGLKLFAFPFLFKE